MRLHARPRVHAEARLRRMPSSGEGRGSLNERLSLLVESGKPLVDLAGVRSDLGSEDHGRATRDDPEVAAYCDDATWMASSASLALVLAA